MSGLSLAWLELCKDPLYPHPLPIMHITHSHSVAHTIKAIKGFIYDGGRFGEFCSGGSGWRWDDCSRLCRNSRRKSNMLPIWRPGNSAGRQQQICQHDRLTSLHPALVDLRFAISSGNKNDLASIWRPARRTVIVKPAGQRPVVRAVKIDDPEVGASPVCHDIHKAPDIDDLRAIR